MGCFLSLYSLSFEEPVYATLTFIILVLLLLLPIIFLNLLSKARPQLNAKKFLSKYGGILETLRYRRGVLSLHFHSLFLWRRLLFVLILFALPGAPIL